MPSSSAIAEMAFHRSMGSRKASILVPALNVFMFPVRYICRKHNTFSHVFQHNTCVSMKITGVNAMCNGCCVLNKPMSAYSQSGLDKLAGIIKNARGSKSLRAFAEEVDGISHSTIGRLENAESDPSDEVLMILAEHTPYSYEELKAIAQGRQPKDARIYASAEDVFSVARKLSEIERRRLMHMLLDYVDED